MGGNGLKEWNGMRGGGRRSRESFKTGDARAKVFNKVFTTSVRLGLEALVETRGTGEELRAEGGEG